MSGDDEDIKIWNIGAKYKFMDEPDDNVSLAIGGSLGEMKDGDSVDVQKAFIAVSKNLTMKQAAGQPIAAKATAGLLYERQDDPVDQSLTKPYVGIDFTLKRGAQFGLEYRFKDDDLESDAVFSAALRYPFGNPEQPVWVQLGTTNNTTGFGTNDQDVFFGIGYRFGGGAAD